MYYTQQTTSETRDTLLTDPANSQPYNSKHSQPLPSISSMSLPGLPHSPRNHQLPDYRGPYDGHYSSGPSGPHPYSSSHMPGELDHHSSSLNRPQYGVDAPTYQDRDHRFISQQESFYRSGSSRAPPEVDDFTSQLDPSLMLSQQTTYLPRGHSTAESSSSHSPEATEDTSASRPRKTRREKPHIDLAPDQPLTTQGRPRARVYVACVQCRTRKIRCDGAKPACHNCTRRAKATDECSYDAAPKRRGPDKTPGARQRMAREARQESESDVVASRRRRRKKHELTSTTPPANELNGGDNGPQPPSGLALPPLRQPALVLDPQLTDMPPFPEGSVTASASLHPESLGAGTASVITGAMPELDEEALYRMTNSQGLLHNVYSFSSGLDIQPTLSSGTSECLTHGFLTPFEEEDSESSEEYSNITSEPSLDFARKTWWDSLLSMYTSSSSQLPSLTMSQRQQASNQVTSDLRFLFRTSNYWFTFINVPHFLSRYFDPDKRDRMHPSLLPAALAIATFFQSSEAGFGKEGREKALRLRDIAQGALEASLNAQWIDEELAQAAWLLALFEVCSHPSHTSERCSSGVIMLDTIIRTLSLTFVDMENPGATKFSRRTVPAILPAQDSWIGNDTFLASTSNMGTPPRYPMQGCSCISRSLGQRWAASHEHTPLWVSSPAWDDSWSEAEIRKETCRRICWSTLVLTAGHTSYVTSTNRAPSDMFILEPANFTLLFPGEAMSIAGDNSGKDTIWSLNYRTMLLWHSCLRMRYDANATEAETARFGVNAWLEADALEKALDTHTCGLERTYLFQGREYLFNVRLTISHEFQRYIPLATANANGLFHRKKAEEWLTHQANVAQRVVHGMGAVTGQAANTLLHRPFFAFWFMSQISRALSLWECDNSLTLALDVCIAFFKPIDYLSVLWPCPEQRKRSQRLREQLTEACKTAGRPPPPPCPPEIAL
ncbi:hypothetical protein HYDPIDRAFT_112046 [Hydnomerulius pinastri MD-312]|uniref:Zn(2)-C6 fungal-type domain-containing protein n=1 Tax=Hydnomerulius pinastri MD-312 TaxID=994086 RepID=A0A0C9WG17_9AGAM|nr:hypothetical protein HYDPIDRAFT_112046 [Hydnomerulius pinastri MD-312]